MDPQGFVDRLDELTAKLESVVERYLEARDELTALIRDGAPDARAVETARNRLMDRTIDIAAATSAVEDLMRTTRPAR